MAHYFMREAQCAAADTWYTLQGDGAGGTRANIQIPQGCSKIVGITCSAGFGGTAGVAILVLKLSGNALKEGEQKIPLVAVANVGTSVTLEAECLPKMVVDIPVTAGNELIIQVSNSGADTGTPEFMVGVEVA